MSVYVTGAGAVSAIGMNVEEHLKSLRSEKSGIDKAMLIDEDKLTGEVKLSHEELAEECGLDGRNHSRTSLLALAAARQCFADQPLQKRGFKTGLISSTTVGGMDRTEKYYRNLLKKEAADPSVVLSHDSGNHADTLAQALHMHGYVNTLSTACSSSANAIMLGARLIRAGKLDRVLVGGVDALTRFTVNGFNSLMIYDKDWCRPFDNNREGLNLGEGAAYLLLESEKSLKRSGAEPLARISGWGNTADAYHQTASSPEGKGAKLSMREALNVAELKAEEISYINAHGTGTKNNDLSESTAIKSIFGTSIPPFSSTKAYTGHTLAAAGGLEAVFSVLAIRKGLLPANLNFKTPIEETGLKPVTQTSDGNSIRHVLSNSFGFGGNNTSIIISKSE